MGAGAVPGVVGATQIHLLLLIMVEDGFKEGGKKKTS